MYKRTILIVDDEEINRIILGNILQKDYEILYAENGQQALECVRQNAERLSAILLDIIMPVMNGYQVLEEMQKEEELVRVPVIVSSQRDGDEAEVKALSLGAQDFISKPYKADIIRHRVSNLIRLRESAATINRAQKDQLTGLYNKEFFLTKAEEILRQNPEHRYDILCFGIERFKLINDTYGTKRGDEVLRYIGKVLVETTGEQDICGRFTADQFYVLIRHVVEYTNEMFEGCMDRIRSCPVDMDVKIHCGIYEITDPQLEVLTMCDRAQLASNTNRGCYDRYFSYYDDSLRQKLLDEQFIISTMQTAIEEKQFQVYYQPKYDLSTELIAGAEALVRWIHPQKGFMSPGDFIPVFEKNGFITQLDMYVWETTCKNIRKWIDLGYPSVAVSVNVSRADIYNPKLIDILLGMVDKYQIPIKLLHLEITESAYTDNPKQIIDSVGKLRDAGFVIEMDDFGSGYSSLNMLAEMPVDVLKLDMRFIQTESDKASGRGIISFIISLAKWMNLSVVAEGVETAEQIAVLRSMDCNYVQGFYYARPMPENDFVTLLESSAVTEMVCSKQTTIQYVSEKTVHRVADGRVMLVVDDIEVNRASLAATFMEEFVIEEAENGKVAWKYLDSNYEKVDVVMLDLLMPVMDGFQLLKKVRADERMKNLPVIITSQGDQESEQKALLMKADDFISKPYNVDIIRHRVANVVGNYQYRCIKEDIIDEREEADGTRVRLHLTADEKILQTMEDLKEHFDIVRLVDPKKTLVCEQAADDCEMHSCYSVWGKNSRCTNCTSLRAFEYKTRATKLEHREDGTYFVISQFVPYGEIGAVLEMVTKVDEER